MQDFYGIRGLVDTKQKKRTVPVGTVLGELFCSSVVLFSSGASASASVAGASVASAAVNTYCLFYANAIAIAARTLFGLLATRCERYSNNSCEQKC